LKFRRSSNIYQRMHNSLRTMNYRLSIARGLSHSKNLGITLSNEHAGDATLVLTLTSLTSTLTSLSGAWQHSTEVLAGPGRCYKQRKCDDNDVNNIDFSFWEERNSFKCSHDFSGVSMKSWQHDEERTQNQICHWTAHFWLFIVIFGPMIALWMLLMVQISLQMCLPRPGRHHRYQTNHPRITCHQQH